MGDFGIVTADSANVTADFGKRASSGHDQTK